MPVSRTAKRRRTRGRIGLRQAGASQFDFTGQRKFDRIVDQVGQHLRQAQWITLQLAWHLGGNLQQVFQTLVMRFLAGNVGDMSSTSSSVNGTCSTSKLARFDFGKIQNVIQNAQQRQAGPVNFVHIILLFRIEFGAERQMGHGLCWRSSGCEFHGSYWPKIPI